MKVITAKDIDKMLTDKIQESLKVTKGKGDKQKILISAGFKIMHLESGLIYTVDNVKIVNGKPVIIAHSGDDHTVEIYPKDFKNYKGL
jgi:hypothetical protein